MLERPWRGPAARVEVLRRWKALAVLATLLPLLLLLVEREEEAWEEGLQLFRM